jgi:uncharacterized protein YbjT (DUF2867 family)
MRVILFGASGMVGEGVLLEILKHGEVTDVLVIGRRLCGITHKNLTEILHQDLFDHSSLETRLQGYDACFFCLGVSSVGMKEAEYTRTTYDLTMQVAGTLARLNPSMTFCYVSGQATDGTEQGRIMWARVKGRTENHISRLPFKAVYHFRPGLMRPTKGQKNIKPILRAVAALYPVVRVVFPRSVCTLEELGRAMLGAATAGFRKHVLEVRDILELARSVPVLKER